MKNGLINFQDRKFKENSAMKMVGLGFKLLFIEINILGWWKETSQGFDHETAKNERLIRVKWINWFIFIQ